MTSNDYFQKAETLPTGSQLDLDTTLAHLCYNADGLIPVITQEKNTGQVLMMAWMNAEALAITLRERYVCYWSRSRQQLWRKGETSGHKQRLIELRIDCDGDCLLCLVDQQGPACHTGRTSCFYWQVDQGQIRLEDS